MTDREGIEGAELKVTDLRAGYGEVNVLQDVSFRLAAGGSIALLGVNGSGKSTLVSAIAGTLPVTNGSIHLDGRPMEGSSASRRALAGLGIVPERRGILPSLSVQDNIRSAIAALKPNRADQRAALERAVELFPALGKRIRQRAGSLSGGEQQMVATARVLVRSPRVIIADEISLGLAPRVVDEVMEQLVKANGSGTSLLLIEQHVGRVLAVTQQALILRRGELVWRGRSAEANERVRVEYLGRSELASGNAGPEVQPTGGWRLRGR